MQSLGTTVEALSKGVLTDQSLPVKQRLIVLVPDVDFDEIAFGKAVWGLALEQKREVVFLAVVNNPDSELRAIHRNAVLSATTRDARFQVGTQIIYCQTWLAALSSLWRPGDLIVSLAEHWIRVRIFVKQPAGQFLAAKLGGQYLTLPSTDCSPGLGR